MLIIQLPPINANKLAQATIVGEISEASSEGYRVKTWNDGAWTTKCNH